MNKGSVSAVIINYNTQDYTAALVEMLRRHCASSLAGIVVVDNGSDPPFSYPETEGVHIVRFDYNSGYSAACNAGIGRLDAEYYFILNSDIEIHSDVLTPLIAAMERFPRAGAFSPRIEYPDGRYQVSWGDEPSIVAEFFEKYRQRQVERGKGFLYVRRMRQAHRERKVDWILGAVMLLRGSALKDIGGFDEGYYFYFEDVDVCSRIRRAGYDVMVIPGATMIHYGGGSQNGFNPRIAESYRSGQLRFYARFHGRISFYVLKIYLSVVFGLRLLTNKTKRDSYARVLSLVREFRYSSVPDRV